MSVIKHIGVTKNLQFIGRAITQVVYQSYKGDSSIYY